MLYSKYKKKKKKKPPPTTRGASPPQNPPPPPKKTPPLGGPPPPQHTPPLDMEPPLTQLPFWSSLTEQEQETLRRSAFVRHYEKGAFIHSSDTECLGMLFVLSGEIRAYLLSEEGREVTLFRLYPGELCVLSASCVISQITFDTQMTAGMDTEVLIIPANIIAAIKEKNLYVRCFLYELATKRFSDVMWAMQQIMFKGLDRRLAEFLLPKRNVPAPIRYA